MTTLLFTWLIKGSSFSPPPCSFTLWQELKGPIDNFCILPIGAKILAIQLHVVVPLILSSLFVIKHLFTSDWDENEDDDMIIINIIIIRAICVHNSTSGAQLPCFSCYASAAVWDALLCGMHQEIMDNQILAGFMHTSWLHHPVLSSLESGADP